jgi:hypothetical protein
MSAAWLRARLVAAAQRRSGAAAQPCGAPFRTLDKLHAQPVGLSQVLLGRLYSVHCLCEVRQLREQLPVRRQVHRGRLLGA